VRCAVQFVPHAGYHDCSAADCESKRNIIHVQDDDAEGVTASEESTVAHVTRPHFSNEIEDHPGRHRKRVAFSTPQARDPKLAWND
jgi:hypothetical protein